MRADPGRRLAELLAIAGLAAALAGCATRRAPREWLPYAEEAQVEAYGGWIRVVRPGGETPPPRARPSITADEPPDGPNVVRGELIAITPDSLYALAGQTLTPVPLTDVRSMTLEYYDPRSRDMASITAAGTLLTITHGWGLIVTAPLWLIVGSTSTATLSHRGQVNADQMAGAAAAGGGSAGSGGRVVSWKDLRIHARFPQGLPPGLDRTRLHERPRPVHPQRSKRAPGSITER